MLATASVTEVPTGSLGGDSCVLGGLDRAWLVVRGALPAVVVATVVPLLLFYSLSAAVSMKWGIVASLGWSYLVLGRQLFTARRISGLIVIAATTLTVRCVAYALHPSTFTYFFVPVVDTVAIAALFVISFAFGRPLLVSLARDFVPAVGDGLSHPDRQILVRRLSCLWGLVYLGSAASSATLLSTQNIHWFLVFHQLSGWAWSGLGLTVTFVYGRRHAGELFAQVTGSPRRFAVG